MPADRESLFVVLAFDANNRLAVRRSISGFGLVFTGPDLAGAMAALAGVLPGALEPREACAASDSGTSYRIHFTQATGALLDPSIVFLALDSLQAPGNRLDPALSAVLSAIEPHLIAVPYLHLGETDFIYKFRPETERNSRHLRPGRGRRGPLPVAALFAAIKALARRQRAHRGRPRSRSISARCATSFRAISASASGSRTRSSAPMRPSPKIPAGGSSCSPS